MELIRFYVLVIKIAIALAIVGQLKSCTLELLGISAEKTGQGMISYSQYTRQLFPTEKLPGVSPKSTSH